jgi:hypothetical protein
MSIQTSIPNSKRLLPTVRKVVDVLEKFLYFAKVTSSFMETTVPTSP